MMAKLGIKGECEVTGMKISISKSEAILSQWGMTKLRTLNISFSSVLVLFTSQWRTECKIDRWIVEALAVM